MATDAALTMVLELRAAEDDAESLALWVEVSGTSGDAYTYDMYFQATADAGPQDWSASEDWRNRFLYDWVASFAGDTVAGVHVSHAMVARYQQIYHADFPDRWRAFALGRIAVAGPVTDAHADVRTRALERPRSMVSPCPA